MRGSRISNVDTKLILDVGCSQVEVDGFWGSTWRISLVILRVQQCVRLWGTSKVTNFKIFILVTLWICIQLAERSILSILKFIVWPAVEEMQYSRGSWLG
jgi:hypothetical protein